MVVCVCVCVPLYYGCLVWIQLVLVRSEVQCIHINFNIKWAISIFILPFIFHQQIIFIYLWKDIHYGLIFLQSNKNTPRLSMYYLKSSRDYLNWTMSSLCCRLHDNVNNIQLYFISYDLHRMCIPAAHSMHVECIQLRLIFIILLVKANINKNTNNTRSQFESHHYRLFVVVFSFTKCSLDLNKISYVHGVHKRITNVKTCTFLSKIDIWMRKVKSCKTNGEKKSLKSRNSNNVSFYLKISYFIWLEHVWSLFFHISTIVCSF